MRHQQVITLGTFAAEFGTSLPCCMTSVARRGNLQNLADRLDPVLAPVRIDKAFQFFKRRSSSAWAKNALAVFRISLARRSSLFSRSSCLSRSRSDVVRPSRWPPSTSSRLTQSSKVWGTQPIFGAIDSTAAHRDGYSPRCYCTSRTARSRTSGENLFVLFMAPFSQRLEPPQNPGRFNLLVHLRVGCGYILLIYCSH